MGSKATKNTNDYWHRWGHSVALNLGNEGSPTAAIKQLLIDLIGATESLSACLYTLNLSRSQFQAFLVVGRSTKDTAPIKVKEILQSANPETIHKVSPLIRSILLKDLVVVDNFEGLEEMWHHPDATSLLAVPIIREGACIGAIQLDSGNMNHFGEDQIALAELSGAIVPLLLEKHETLGLLEGLQSPIDFSLPFSEFVNGQLEVAAYATGMPYLILREWDGHGALECLGCYGFDNVPYSSLDLPSIDRFPLFKQAIKTGETQAYLPNESSLSDLPNESNAELSLIRSFMVAPIRVAEDRVFGTLSCGVETEYVYSRMDRLGLQAIAKSVGTAITNYANAHRAAEARAAEAVIGSQITIVEVAQAARHEVRNSLAQASMVAAQIYALVQSGKTDRELILDKIEDLSRKHGDADQALNRIKQITKPPKRELDRVHIDELWRQAFGMVQSRLSELRIAWHVEGKSVRLNAYSEHLRHAFLNLILNSADAFKNTRRKRDRSIVVRINSVSSAANTVEMRYMDNGTGLDIPRLQRLRGQEWESPNDIFLAGVTSKDGGSGFGLYLVRRILLDHRGSIEMISHKNGVIFDLTISTRL